MVNLNEKIKNKKSDNQAHSAEKQPYEPPKATLVELRLDEKLMVCSPPSCIISPVYEPQPGSFCGKADLLG